MGNNDKDVKTLEKVKHTANQAKDALESANLALEKEILDKVAGGGAFDKLPTVDEHPYNPDARDRY